METNRYLGIYLNDHLAGATAGRELAKRCLSNNEGTPLGAYLETLIDEIDEDRAALERLMERLDVPVSPWKRQALWLAEKVGRLKMNGQVFGYSDLSRVEELETLLLGVTGKLILWRSLAETGPQEPRLEVAELAVLAERAERQLRILEGHHRDAVKQAFQKPDIVERNRMQNVPIAEGDV
ncbi:MAG TPA: hypothetical protein VM638_05950 [Actinomycetota bacterium]|nr:hypothetical protein [Actinomycetota bacterium]